MAQRSHARPGARHGPMAVPFACTDTPAPQLPGSPPTMAHVCARRQLHMSYCAHHPRCLSGEPQARPCDVVSFVRAQAPPLRSKSASAPQHSVGAMPRQRTSSRWERRPRDRRWESIEEAGPRMEDVQMGATNGPGASERTSPQDGLQHSPLGAERMEACARLAWLGNSHLVYAVDEGMGGCGDWESVRTSAHRTTHSGYITSGSERERERRAACGARGPTALWAGGPSCSRESGRGRARRG